MLNLTELSAGILELQRRMEAAGMPMKMVIGVCNYGPSTRIQLYCEPHEVATLSTLGETRQEPAGMHDVRHVARITPTLEAFCLERVAAPEATLVDLGHAYA